MNKNEVNDDRGFSFIAKSITYFLIVILIVVSIMIVFNLDNLFVFWICLLLLLFLIVLQLISIVIHYVLCGARSILGLLGWKNDMDNNFQSDSEHK